MASEALLVIFSRVAPTKSSLMISLHFAPERYERAILAIYEYIHGHLSSGVRTKFDLIVDEGKARCAAFDNDLQVVSPIDWCVRSIRYT